MVGREHIRSPDSRSGWLGLDLSPRILPSLLLFSAQVNANYCLQMGAHKYISELARKKQSDVNHFLLRVRCWEVSSWL